MTLVVGDLFSGIGGFSLAAQWMGWRTAWFSEIDLFASAVLAARFPGVPNHGDITRIDFTTVDPVDVLVGGFPCQDISNAGRRAGIAGSRSGLWAYFAHAIRVLRPRYVLVENVAAITRRGLDTVLGDVAAIGYDADWACFRASDLGAPHARDRWWLLAWRPCAETVADGERARLEGHAWDEQDGAGGAQPGGSAGASRVRRGADPAAWWRPEPALGGAPYGVSGGVDRPAAWERGVPRVVPRPVRYREQLTALGNAIVPQCAWWWYQQIEAKHRTVLWR